MHPPLSDEAEHFAPTGSARSERSVITPRGVETIATKAVHHARADRRCPIDTAQAGTAHALDALDNRTTGVVFRGTVASSKPCFVTDSKTVDVTFALQTPWRCQPSAWRRASRQSSFAPAAVANARQHIGDRIRHTHLRPYQLALVMPGTSPRKRLRAACYGTDRIYGRHHADDRSARSGYADGSDWNCAAVAAGQTRSHALFVRQLGVVDLFEQAARLAANFATIFARFLRD